MGPSWNRPWKEDTFGRKLQGSHEDSSIGHLRWGHMTNASLKQWVVILLLLKIDRTHENYLTPEIWEETHLRETFYVTLIFQQSSMICIGRHVLLPSNMAAKTIFYLSRVKCLIVTFRCAINATTSSFQHFPWSLSAKLVSESGNS